MKEKNQVSLKTALIIYFIITPILVITGYLNNILLAIYIFFLFTLSFFLTIFENF